MKHSLLLLSMLTVALTTCASTDKPTDAELSDWTAYVGSVDLPVVSEVCSPLLAGKAAYSEVAEQWLNAHAEEIKRGHDFAVAVSPKGRDFAQHDAAMRANFKQRLMAKSHDAKLKICNESLKALQHGVEQQGGA